MSEEKVNIEALERENERQYKNGMIEGIQIAVKHIMDLAHCEFALQHDREANILRLASRQLKYQVENPSKEAE